MTDSSRPPTSPPTSKWLSATISDLESTATERDSAVELSTELVGLLSAQLYRSPVKAIEELVVNSYDAGADICLIFVPDPAAMASNPDSWIAVWDNGQGMDAQGLIDLWNIGASPKREPGYKPRLERQQIGKFGIGKLATYTIAHQVTYISRCAGHVHAVTLTYDNFSTKGRGHAASVPLRIVSIKNMEALIAAEPMKSIASQLDLKAVDFSGPQWTLVVLERLKPKAQEIRHGRLKWTLSTAMPMAANFLVSLNGLPVTSPKDEFTKVVDFAIADLPDERLQNLSDSTGVLWTRTKGALTCKHLPSGVSGTVSVFDRSIRGKSDDLLRSYGFFVRVRNRLLNEDDALFGLDELSFTTFNRFRADVQADDLDASVLASREDTEASLERRLVQSALREVFNEARVRLEALDASDDKDTTHKREPDRSFVAPRLMERPLADVLATDAIRDMGADADGGWFYIVSDTGGERSTLLDQLYSGVRSGYEYEYVSRGVNGRMVKLNPATGVFSLNADHEFIRAYKDEPAAQQLLHDVATAEAMLEVYLREFNVLPQVVGEVLTRHDLLLRGLARDHVLSFGAIAGELRDSAANERDLEVSLIRAARALGFNAKHVSGAGQPDGIARFISRPEGERRITLEAKSSKGTPTLGALDFSGLKEHVRDHQADGCLLVAPSYPGSSLGSDSSASDRAREGRISCWTIDNLSRVLSSADARHITARDILNIVLTRFANEDVSAAIDSLLANPSWDRASLFREIIDRIHELQGRLKDRPLSIEIIAGSLVSRPGVQTVLVSDVRDAIIQLAGASKGGLVVSGADKESVHLATSVDELRVRLAPLLGIAAPPRGRGSFLANNVSGDETDLGEGA